MHHKYFNKIDLIFNKYVFNDVYFTCLYEHMPNIYIYIYIYKYIT